MPGAVGQRLVVLAVADAVVLDADRDHHGVVVAVVGAEDLDDRVAAGVAAGDPDRVHRRLRARVQKAPAVDAPAPLQLLGDEHAVLGRGREVRALGDALADRPDDRGVGVPLDHRAEAVVEVPHAVAVDVVDDRPLAGRQVDRPRVARLVAGGDAAARASAARARTSRRLPGVRSSSRAASRSIMLRTRSRSSCTVVSGAIIWSSWWSRRGRAAAPLRLGPSGVAARRPPGQPSRRRCDATAESRSQAEWRATPAGDSEARRARPAARVRPDRARSRGSS